MPANKDYTPPNELPPVPCSAVLRGQTALVTGASKGLGQAVAIAFAEAGANVLVNYSSDEAGARHTAKTIEALGAKAEIFKANVAKEVEVQAMFRHVAQAFGRLDICVPNSAVQLNAPVDEMTLEQWQGVIDVNLTGVFLCSREAIRMFRRQGIDRSISYACGKLIMMSSVHDIIPWEGHANYAAAKGGLMLFMKSLAQEVAHQRIRVNSLSPGAIRTPMNVGKLTSPEMFESSLLKLIPCKRIGEPEDVARAAVWLASDQSDYIYGTTIYIDGGMTLYPGFIGQRGKAGGNFRDRSILIGSQGETSMAEAMPETGNHTAGDNQARDSQVRGNQALDNQERLDRMRRTMAENRLDALVVRLPENVLLLSGFWPMIGATVLVFPLEGSPVCIVPDCYEQEASRSLWESRAAYYKYGVLGAPDPKTAIRQSLQGVHGSERWRRIGYEGSFEVAAPSWNSAESLVPAAPTLEMLKGVFGRGQLIDTTGLLESQRRRKTAYECAKLRLASEISVFGMEAFEAAAETGASGVELVALVEREIMVRGTGYGGVSRVRAFAQVAVGNEESAIGYRPNEVSTARRLASGDVALLELGVVADGYWADRTRLRVAGQATDEQAKIFEIVLGAQEAAIATIRAGVSGDEVDQAARSVIREAGYGDSFPHITGHGLGFRYHESSPILAPKSFEVLEEGMLTSVEPGIYLERAGGFRIEDDVLVRESGAEVLGKFRKAIQ